MFQKYNNQLIRTICTTLGTLLICTAANASTVTIKSEETVDLDIIIEGGTGTVLPNKKEIKDTIKPGEEKVFEITKTTFDNQDLFTITGKVRMPSLHNKCELLSVDKDYKVVFTSAKTGGTICKASAIN